MPPTGTTKNTVRTTSGTVASATVPSRRPRMAASPGGPCGHWVMSAHVSSQSERLAEISASGRVAGSSAGTA